MRRQHLAPLAGKPPSAGLSGDFASGGQRAMALWNPYLAFGEHLL